MMWKYGRPHIEIYLFKAIYLEDLIELDQTIKSFRLWILDQDSIKGVLSHPEMSKLSWKVEFGD